MFVLKTNKGYYAGTHSLSPAKAIWTEDIRKAKRFLYKAPIERMIKWSFRPYYYASEIVSVPNPMIDTPKSWQVCRIWYCNCPVNEGPKETEHSETEGYCEYCSTYQTEKEIKETFEEVG